MAAPGRAAAQVGGRPKDSGGGAVPVPGLRGLDYGVVLWSGAVLFPRKREVDADLRPIRPSVAMGFGRFRIDFDHAWWQPAPGWRIRSRTSVEKLGKSRVFGYGNSTDRDGISPSFFRVNETRFEVHTTLTHTASGGWLQTDIGPVFRHVTTGAGPEHVGLPGTDDARLISVQQPFGAGAVSEVGMLGRLRIHVASTDGETGLGFTASGAVFPAVLSLNEPFAKFEGEFHGGLSIPLPLRPAVALRVGGSRVVGTAPFFEGVFLGGSHTLRGYSYHRFLGDASLYGGADIRFALGTVRAFGTGVRAGILGLGDVGRVYSDGVSAGGWHFNAGGGMWFQPDGWQTMMHVAVVESGDGSHVFGRIALPFE